MGTCAAPAISSSRASGKRVQELPRLVGRDERISISPDEERRHRDGGQVGADVVGEQPRPGDEHHQRPGPERCRTASRGRKNGPARSSADASGTTEPTAERPGHSRRGDEDEPADGLGMPCGQPDAQEAAE